VEDAAKKRRVVKEEKKDEKKKRNRETVRTHRLGQGWVGLGIASN
jgi:hypothetical protein